MPLVPTLALALATIGEPSVGEGIGLKWTAPSACPQESEVREAIDLNLAREVFSEQLAAVEVHGAIEETNDGWVLRVRTELPSGWVEREVDSVECAELAAAAGLIIAVALDPLRVVETVSPNSEPAPANEPPPTLDPRPRPQPEAPTLVHQRSFDLRLGLLGEIGSLNVPRAGVWAGAGVKTRRVRFDVAGQYWGPRQVLPFGQARSAGVMVQQGGVAAKVCVIPTNGALEIASCLGADAGVARARGVGLDVSRVTNAPWVAMSIGQALTWVSKHRIGAWVAADAMVHIVRPQWRVRDLGVAAKTGPVGFRLVMGPTLRL